MPELPEVETVRRRLEPVLVGRSFEPVEIEDARLTRPEDPAEVAAELTGERVASLERRGKYLVVRFESGRVLLFHLRMTGNVRFAPAGEPVDEGAVHHGDEEVRREAESSRSERPQAADRQHFETGRCPRILALSGGVGSTSAFI